MAKANVSMSVSVGANVSMSVLGLMLAAFCYVSVSVGTNVSSILLCSNVNECLKTPH